MDRIQKAKRLEREQIIKEIIQKLDICQLVWLTKNTSYENVGGIFLRKNTIDS